MKKEHVEACKTSRNPKVGNVITGGMVVSDLKDCALSDNAVAAIIRWLAARGR